MLVFLRGIPGRLLLFAVCAGVLAARPSLAQQPAAAGPLQSEHGQASRTAGTVAGTVTTQNGTIPLGGALVSLKAAAGEVATYVSDGEGAFRFENVAPGSYTIVVALDGFDPLTIPVSVASGQVAAAKANLRIATVSERVDVVASTAIVPTTGTLTASDGLTGKRARRDHRRRGLQSALRLLASVIEMPGWCRRSRGRQASRRCSDPALGRSGHRPVQVSLPDDAIDNVTVLPNPYAVE